MTKVCVKTEAILKGKIRKDFAWKIIAAYEEYPKIMENVDTVKIHEKNGNEGTSEWFVSVEDAPLTWLEKDYFDENNHEIHFESIDGDFESINGIWKVEDFENSGIKIHFNIEYNLGIPVIEEVLGHILKEKMKSNMDSMLKAIKEELSKKEVEERRFERISVATFNNLIINGSLIRCFIVNISQGGLLFYYDKEIESDRIILEVGPTKIEAELLFNDIQHKNCRIVFKSPLSEKDLKNVIFHVKNKHIREFERKLIYKSVIIDNGHSQQTVFLINFSPKGMLVSLPSDFKGFGNSFKFFGETILVRQVVQNIEEQKARVIFRETIQPNVFESILNQIANE